MKRFSKIDIGEGLLPSELPSYDTEVTHDPVEVQKKSSKIDNKKESLNSIVKQLENDGDYDFSSN